MSTDIQFRNKLSHSIVLSILFVLLLLASLWAIMARGSDLEIDGFGFGVTAALMGVFIIQQLSSKSTGKYYAIGISLLCTIIILPLMYYFPKPTLGVIAVTLFGGAGSWYVWVNLIARQPIIIINESSLRYLNGIYAGRYHTISWSNITSITAISQQNYGNTKSTFLGINVADEQKFITENAIKPGIRKGLLQLNTLITGTTLAVDITHLEVSADELVAICQHHIDQS